MTKSRYTLYLSGATTANATQVISFSYDMRTLIPVAKRGKKFLLLSAFDTSDQGVIVHSALQVGINIVPQYNQSSPPSQYITLGIAQPVYCSGLNGASARFKYSYPETSYLAKMIEYPEIDTINVQITSVSGIALAVGTFSLYLSFEEMSDE